MKQKRYLEKQNEKNKKRKKEDAIFFFTVLFDHTMISSAHDHLTE